MQVSGVDGGQQFDFSKTSEAYSKYRDIYPEKLYTVLKNFGVAADGSSWLDLGTGTGILPKNLYNPKARIVGADISERQIAYAKADAEKNNMKIRYIAAAAEDTGLPDNSFDVITAAQCFAYFDKVKIASEIKRLIKPGGKFIIIFLDWDPDDEIFIKSAELIKKHNPLWNPGTDDEQNLIDDVFPASKTDIYECGIPFTRDSWHGRMCACRGTLASMDKDTFLLWEKEHLNFLKSVPEKFTVKHKLFITVFSY